MNDKELIELFKKENKILKNWMLRNIGERCPDYVKDCIVCDSWKMFDKLKYLEESSDNDNKESKK